MSNDITATTQASSVSPFTGSESAPTGFRVVSLHWKSRKATDSAPAVAKRPSVSIVVPCITLDSVQPKQLQAACQESVNALQDDLVRSLIEAQSVDAAIPHLAFDVIAVASYAAAVATSKRLSKDGILSWFDANLQDQLMAALTVALANGSDPTDLDMTKLVKGVEVYRNQFAELAMPRPSVSVGNATKLLAWTNKAQDKGSSVYSAVVSKLNLLTKQTDVEILI
jgi:hypothetical protein